MSERKGRAEVQEWKVETVKKLVDTLKNSEVVGLVDLRGLPADYLKRVRFELRDDFDLIFARKNLIRLALDELGWDDFKQELSGMPAVIVSDNDPFRLYRKLSDKRSPAFAKPGQNAPKDIKVSKGPTPVPAGPALGEFKSAEIPARIKEGKIAITKSTVVVEENEEINEAVAGILRKLNIKPFTVMFDVIAVKEGDTIYPADVLQIDTNEVFQDFVNAHSWAFNLALDAGYPTKETLELIILDAFQKAKSLAISEALLEPEVIEDLLALANYHAIQVGGEEVEYVYAAMLLHKAGQDVKEASLKKVLEAAGTKVDEARVKALVSALEEVDIEEAIKKAPAAAAAPAAPAPAAEGKEEGKKEEAEEEEEEEVSEEEAASGLSSLFG